MATEPYIPDEVELIGCYAGVMEEQAGENYATAKADAERGIAKLKADALREAADHLDSFEGPGGRRSAQDQAGRDIIRIIRECANQIEGAINE